MKEYICKEDFIKMWEQGLVAVPIHADGGINWDDIYTVTKADICREFTRERNDKIDLWQIDSISDFREEYHKAEQMVLAEMENE